MDKIRFETLVPDELTAAIEGRSLALLPVGSMEWHGPHMAMGVDTYNAYEIAQRAARALGGVVMPPLYIGTERPRSPEQLKRVGFRGDETIVGMDFPGNAFRSFYWPQEFFETLITTQVQMLLNMGFRQVAIINGHGAKNQLEILSGISSRLSAENNACVTYFMALVEGCGAGLGHAGLAETAIFMRLCPEGVQLEKLPERSVPLKNTAYAIVDSETFAEGPNEDYTVRYDPRDATEELGEHILSYTAEAAIRQIRDAWAAFRKEAGA